MDVARARIPVSRTFLLLVTLVSFPMLGLALTPFPEKGLWGYVDSEGSFVIEPQYARASAFNPEGYVIVEVPQHGGKGYWLPRTRSGPDSIHSFAGPPRDADNQQVEGLEVALWWQHEYTLGPVDLFAFIGSHGDSSGMFAALEQLDKDPNTRRDQLLSAFEASTNNLDHSSSDEVTYRILTRDGSTIHEFRQKDWVRPEAPMGHTLYYQEMRESFGDPMTMVSLNLKKMELRRIPLESGMWGQPFGEHLIIANPTVQFLQNAVRAGDTVKADIELPQSRIASSHGETLFQTNGYANTFTNSDSEFHVMNEGKSHFARMPDGIFAGPFHRCFGFAEQRGLVLLDENTYSYVNEDGALLSESGFAYATLFHDGHAIIRHDGNSHWEIITPDLVAQAVIEGVDEVLRPTAGAIPFRQGEKWGYMDLVGNEKIPAQFDAIGDFVDGVALVLDGMTLVLINEAGDRIRESTLPSYEVPALPLFPGSDPFEMQHDPDEWFGRDPFLEQRGRR